MADVERFSDQLYAAVSELRQLENTSLIAPGSEAAVGKVEIFTSISIIASTGMREAVRELLESSQAGEPPQSTARQKAGIPLRTLGPGMLQEPDDTSVYPLMLAARDTSRPNVTAVVAASALGYSRFHISNHIRSGVIPGFGVRKRERTSWYAYSAALAKIAIKQT